MMRFSVDARFVTLATVAIVTVVTDANSALVRSVAAARGTIYLLHHRHIKYTLYSTDFVSFNQHRSLTVPEDL